MVRHSPELIGRMPAGRAGCRGGTAATCGGVWGGGAAGRVTVGVTCGGRGRCGALAATFAAGVVVAGGGAAGACPPSVAGAGVVSRVAGGAWAIWVGVAAEALCAVVCGAGVWAAVGAAATGGGGVGAGGRTLASARCS